MGATAPDAWLWWHLSHASSAENVGCRNGPTETLGQIRGSRRGSWVSKPTFKVEHTPNGAEVRQFRPGNLVKQGTVVPDKEKWWS
jgi:hypothetical protein